MARFGQFGHFWPDSGSRFGQIWPLLARFGSRLARFGSRLARSGQFGHFWPDSWVSDHSGQGGSQFGDFDLARGGQIPGGAPNWHKSGGGGISCIRSSGTLSPGTYRSQIFGETGTRALGTRILGTFWEFSAEMDHFSGTRFWTPQDRILDPPWPDSGPPLARTGPPDWPDSASLATFGHFWPLLARFRVQIGQIRPDSLKCGVPESWSDP